jgi:hypothetical protein
LAAIAGEIHDVRGQRPDLGDGVRACPCLADDIHAFGLEQCSKPRAEEVVIVDEKNPRKGLRPVTRRLDVLALLARRVRQEMESSGGQS